MLFKSSYRIEFSQSKETVLENIKSSLLENRSNLPKNFIGNVSENGFKIKLLGRYSPDFKGSFDQGNNLQLTVGLGLLQIISLLFIVLAVFYMYYKNEYYTMAIILALGIFIIQASYYNIKVSKRKFFDYLLGVDSRCKISDI